MTENKREDLLSSWKEIAAYLGCDERTCLRWEKLHGLPVRRLNGGAKSRVYAFREELDAWLAARSTNGGGPHPLAGESFRDRHRLRRYYPWAAAVLLVAVAVWHLVPRKGPPADFWIEGSRLVVLDARGRVLWRHDTGAADLYDDPQYRSRLQVRRISSDPPGRLLPWISFLDLDADGSVEVLFSLETLNETGGGIVRCFAADGRERWAFEAGRPVTFGEMTFASDFVLKGFLTFDVEGDGRSEILVLSHALHEFPSQAAVLDAGGRLRGEYWNSGQWDDADFADVNGDGRKEILLAGQNNEYQKGAIALIDADMALGSSPQVLPKYRCLEFPAGGEMAYLLMPLTELDELYNPGVNVNTVEALGDGTFRVTTFPTDIELRLGRDIRLLAPNLSHNFERQYREKFEAGKLTAPFDAARIEAGLRGGIRYWDGSAWSPNPVIRPARRRD